MTTRQITIWSALCTVADNRSLGIAAVVIGLCLTFSWVVGLLSLRFAVLRLAYWGLLFMIPLALAAQQGLLDRHILSCDAI
jgi:hypothetical protein